MEWRQEFEEEASPLRRARGSRQMGPSRSRCRQTSPRERAGLETMKGPAEIVAADAAQRWIAEESK